MGCEKELKSFMQNGVSEGVFPGATYCLIEDDKSYFNVVGKKALLPCKEPNALDTLYDIASLTKVIGTTTALLILCEQNRVRLDDKIQWYLPYIRYAHITIRDLLLHCSGYPALTKGTMEMTTAEPLIHDLEHCELVYETGTQVVYSDVGYLYLGFLIDKVTGSLSQFLKAEVFEPLRMYDTQFNPQKRLRVAPTEASNFRGMIRGTVHDEKAFLLGGVAGHAGLFSTVIDLEKYVRMLFRDGAPILMPQSVASLLKKEMRFEAGYRGLGWIVKAVCGGDVLYHTGYTGSHMLVDFYRKKALILLSNRVHPTRDNTQIIAFRKALEQVLYGESL